ncbi:MAG: hypothetical protein JW760_02420 [Spirochaetales bacterium]|nr:hypothetical protein [Spirochaetales bacterium]
MKRHNLKRRRTVWSTAAAVTVCMALSACSEAPPDIEFYCGSPGWTTDKELSTTYSVSFSTGATAMPWNCCAILSFDLYDLDGYVHALATYEIEIEATVEQPSFDLGFLNLSTHTFTLDLMDLENYTRGSTSYTNRIRGIRAIVPREIVFQPDNTLLNPRWWHLTFEAFTAVDGVTIGYRAQSLPD